MVYTARKKCLSMILAMAMVMSLMPALTLTARAATVTLNQDASRSNDTDLGKALLTSEIVNYTANEADGSSSTVVNYVGNIDVWNYQMEAALKFTLPATSSILSSAKLHLPVVNVKNLPSATVTLTDDNSWGQTNDLSTSIYPSLSSATTLLSNQSISNTGDVSLSLDTTKLASKISSGGTTDITLIVTGSTTVDNYFNFVADDDASTDQAYLVLTFKPQVQSVSVPSNGTYKAGDALNFTVTFDSVVIVTGTPRIPVTLNTGGTVYAPYVSGSNSKNLVFRYTVSSGELDADGISLGSAINLNSGTIKNANNDSAELNLYSVAATTNVLVDGVAPSINSVSSPGNATYNIGNNLDYTVNFSEPVNVVTLGGTPYLTLTVGGSTVHATYQSGSGTTALTFRYTVASGDADADGVALSSNVTLNSGTIKDTAGNDATVTFTGGTAAGVLVSSAPTVTDANIAISGGTGTGGAYKIGDTVTATWDNTVDGDNNGNITSVTVDFSQFGGGAAVAATNNSGTWTATYTIIAGAIDATNRNVSVTATDNTSKSTTAADTTNATVDNVEPTVTDGNISISGASGTGGSYKIGDHVTATWNNTAGGDNNADMISGVTVDFSAFGGGAAVAATNSSGTWTATYTIVVGAIDTTNRNVAVTATDDAGNVTTSADTSNSTVDNVAPTVTDGNISISGGTGTGGAFKSGDTVTATWNNTAGGDNNSDITSVTADFSQFGGGAAVAATNLSGTWTATYTITSGAMDATNRNVSFTVTDNAGNTTTRNDTTNATVDNIAPTVSISSTAGANTNTSPISITITFSESVTGFVVGDITVGNGTAGNFVAVSDTIYTADITPSAQGAVTVDVAANVAQDAVGNNNAAATQLSRIYDNTAPTVTISMSKTDFYSGETATVTITFSEAVTGFTNDDLTIPNGTLTAVSSADGGITWTATFTAANVDAATNAIILDLAGITDTVGNSGSGTASSGNYTVAMPTAPGAPTGVTATAGDTQASVSFSAPVSTGGAAITSYTVTSSPGGFTGTGAGAGSPITVTGLTNGVAYTFTVTATNSAGTGTASAASNSVTPRATQTITFNNPGAQNFGTNPTLTATSDSGLTVTFTSETPEVCTITSGGVLTFIRAGTATITANQAGNASYLPATSVHRSFTVNPVVPGAPTGVTAIEGDTQASVSFTAPVSTGGAAITGYTVTSSPGGLTGTGAGAGSPITVNGLTNGVAYTFTVTATNSAGTGMASAASNSVTPRDTQTITFNDPGAQIFGTSPTLTATSDSGLTVTFTSENPEVCTITSGGVLTFIRAGTATITANQAGNASYLPATPVSRSFTVNPVVPGAPTGVTATAGNAQASVSFSAPVANGGASITGYTVTSSPGGITATGAGSPITVTGLTNGVAYTFTVTATNGAGAGTASAASNSVTLQAPSGGSSSTPTTPSIPTVVEVNGQKQDAGTANTQTTGGQTVTTIKVDDTKLDKILASSGEKPTVTLPTNKASDVVVGELNGQTVKNMEQKEAVLEIKTEKVSYTLPAAQINIDDVSSQIGAQVALKDIKVSVKIAEPSADTVKIVENTAAKNSYQIVVKPVEFEISCTSGSKTVEVSKFNGYVERTVAIPDGVDPSKITTGIVLNNDGTFSHVPTQIVVINGKYFAKINSLTNSTYSVIYNPVTFADVASHWAKDAINDMGSRMVVTGIGNSTYEPERSITRAEFAAIVVRALGLRQGTEESSFGDVTLTDWFNGYVDTATAYALITGYDSKAFGPSDTITREQAMAIIARAMKLTELSENLTDKDVDAILAKYSDGTAVSDYAKLGVAACVKSGIVSGTSASTLSPKAYVTRAEVAVMIQHLLEKSGLI